MNETTRERVPEGFKTRIRYGTAGRERFLIRLHDDTAAAKREALMRDVARALTKAGQAAHARSLLTKMGETPDPKVAENVVKLAEGLCGGAVVSTRTSAVTFKDLAEQWTDGTLRRKWPDHVKEKRSVADDIGRFDKLFESIGDVPLVSFTLDDAEKAMAALDVGRSSATRRQYAQLISKVLKLAVYPCKIVERSPLPVGFLPRVKGKKATAYLYPSEDSTLLACTTIPLARRVLYGLLAREGCRFGEATALRWRDLDLVRGVITLDRSKTDEARAWVMASGVKEALKQFKPDEVEADALVFPIDDVNVARRFRSDLREAEVKRPELFDDNATRKQIRVHDLRATFVTLSLAAGRSEAWVADRTGHRSSTMINRYRRQARQVGELKLGELERLDVALPEFAPKPAAVLGGPESGPASEKACSNPANWPSQSSLISAVPKVGVEPTRLFRTTDFESATHVPEVATVRNYSGDDPRKDEKAPVGPPQNDQVGQAARPEASRPSPRAVLVAALVETLGAATVAGDLHAARVAHEALGRLLEEPLPGAASVADLNSERGRRGR